MEGFFLSACVILSVCVMVYASIFTRRMAYLGKPSLYRVARRILGEEISEEELEEAIRDLKSRFRFISCVSSVLALIFLALSLTLPLFVVAGAHLFIPAGISLICVAVAVSAKMIKAQF